jgi:hypothetical protein
MQDAKFNKRRLTSFNYPIRNAAVSANQQPFVLDLKDFEQTGVVARLGFRVFGNIVVAGAGPGAATGQDNPESIMISNTIRTTPDVMSLLPVDNVSARAIRVQSMYERGYDIKAPVVPDVAGTYAVDYEYWINFRQPLAVKPSEFSLPLAAFNNVYVQTLWGGREQCFTGGTNTWDLSGLTVEVWADMDQNIAGLFHMTSFSERTFPAITASQSDFPLRDIPSGAVYPMMLLRTERNNVLVNDILNSWAVQGGGRIWLPRGDDNASFLQRDNREENLSDPNVVQTGLYFLNALRDGYITAAIDSLDSQLNLTIDETSTSGNEFAILQTKRSIPNAISLSGVVAAGGVAPGAGT